jgi:hypothetical protein
VQKVTFTIEPPLNAFTFEEQRRFWGVFKASPPFDGGEPVKPLKVLKRHFLAVWEPFWRVWQGP